MVHGLSTLGCRATLCQGHRPCAEVRDAGGFAQASGRFARQRYSYLFAGMVQHNEEGRPVFMHRAGGTKLVPSQYAIWPVIAWIVVQLMLD